MEFVLFFYCIAAAILAVYGINCHILTYLYKKRLRQWKNNDHESLRIFYSKHLPKDLPKVTTQLPIYNEMNVAERIIDAVAAFEYPDGKHEIQVLDDSTDSTTEIIARKVQSLREAGIQIEHIRRSKREGFKAGALRYGMHKAHGEYLAIFDADFVPPPDFLLKTIPFFLMDPELGLVQGRWGHLNQDESLVTISQSIGINGHFIVEQSARNWNDLFMNFNGTAGIFRKVSILDAGNWQADTLTEDLDLSYRMQLAGWKCRYLIDVVAPAEIPANINAFKGQQFRWAKGSIQTAMKLLPRIWKSDSRIFKKVQATLHITHYIVHPLMVYLAIMAIPLLAKGRYDLPAAAFWVVGAILLLSTTGPSRLYWNAERYASRGRLKRLLALPFLACFGCGIAINNARAVLEGILGRKSEFIRTPKEGDHHKKNYKPRTSTLFLLEILAGLWCLCGTFLYFTAHYYLVGQFLLIYAVGFLFVGVTSYLHQVRVPRPHRTTAP